MTPSHNAARHRFTADTSAGIAELQYTREGDTATFTHTEVPDAANGQGIGTALVEADDVAAATEEWQSRVVDFAETQGFTPAQ